MPDIFDEVDEDLRAERAGRFFRQWGGVLVGVAILAVIATGGWQWRRQHRAVQDARVSDAYIAASTAADVASPDAKAVAAQFEQVAATAPAGYATLSRLRAAALLAESGDLAAASAQWDAVAADGSAPKLLRDLATLQWAEHQIDHGDPAQVAARLAPLASPDNAWHALAEEAQAMLSLRQGNQAAAVDTLRQLAADVTAPDGVRGRANGLLQRFGAQTNGS